MDLDPFYGQAGEHPYASWKKIFARNLNHSEAGGLL